MTNKILIDINYQSYNIKLKKSPMNKKVYLYINDIEQDFYYLEDWRYKILKLIYKNDEGVRIVAKLRKKLFGFSTTIYFNDTEIYYKD